MIYRLLSNAIASGIFALAHLNSCANTECVESIIDLEAIDDVSF